jgi:hypothetical protein
MKIHKKNEHSVLIKPFGFRDKLYLAVTILLFFDLTAPEAPLTEQELWGVIPGQLPKGHALDQGLPKPKREVLLTGSCCAPRGKLWTGAEIYFQSRYQQRCMFLANVSRPELRWCDDLSSPNPSRPCQVTYENAFGGRDSNLTLSQWPMPTKFLGVDRCAPPISRIQPSGALLDDRPQRRLRPLDMMWPQRAKNTVRTTINGCGSGGLISPTT